LKRAVIIILDGVGIGEAPDADQYGDAGSDTLGNVARACGGLILPKLERFGRSWPTSASPSANPGRQS